jgi:hypothetical protein
MSNIVDYAWDIRFATSPPPFFVALFPVLTLDDDDDDRCMYRSSLAHVKKVKSCVGRILLNIFGHALSRLPVGSPMGLVVGLGYLVIMFQRLCV